MKLTFKDLKQQKFVIEAEPSETPKPPPASSSSKAAPSTPAQTAATPAPPAAPAASSGPTTTNVPATPSPAPATTSTGQGFNDPSALALGEERNAAIANMESMGFPRADIDRAMRAAFFNPDRAVEYLLSGIPENIEEQGRGGNQGNQPAAAAASPTPATGTAPAQEAPANTGDEPVNLFEAAAQANRQGGTGGTGGRGASGGGVGAGLGGGAGGGAGGGLGSLEALRNNPQFQQLRQVVQQQPQMLEPILQQVAQGNPQLAQMIQQSPDQFLQLLAEGGGDDDAPMPPGAQSVAVTEEERDAIERLCRLGFERDLVIQAYFACDKNEELAANFLFDQPDEGDDQ
ncbi:MAG: hypothetical protein M1820_007702 [Bogoriella megaspora]|nr:MAG: hypothetical protein M1820_007702 [Bogoriella megaspora]